MFSSSTQKYNQETTKYCSSIVEFTQTIFQGLIRSYRFPKVIKTGVVFLTDQITSLKPGQQCQGTAGKQTIQFYSNYCFRCIFSSVEIQQATDMLNSGSGLGTYYWRHLVRLQIFKVVGVWYLSCRPLTLQNRGPCTLSTM